MNFLTKLFIKDYENVKRESVRYDYGYFASMVGIVSNIILFITKFIIGSLINSIAVIADSFNNLSDCASSIVTLLGFKLSIKPPDEEHPFGHGRAEYLSGVIVATIILLVGFELAKSSFSKILNPEPIKFDLVILFILILSIIVKLWQNNLNKKIGLRINSKVLLATAQDSMNDVITTLAIVISIVLSKFITFSIDGYIGLGIAFFIIYNGYNIFKDTIDPLLGMPADPETIKNIENKVMSFDSILGFHDLIVHNYGHNRSMASIHVELPSDLTYLKVHDIIDNIERSILKDLGIQIVVHSDPICTDDTEINELKYLIEKIIIQIDNTLNFQNLKIVKCQNCTTIILDLEITNKYLKEEQKQYIYTDILSKLSDTNKKYDLVIKYNLME